MMEFMKVSMMKRSKMRTSRAGALTGAGTSTMSCAAWRRYGAVVHEHYEKCTSSLGRQVGPGHYDDYGILFYPD